MFENLLNKVDTVLYTAFSTSYLAMSAAVAPVLVGAITILVALYGLSLAFGRDFQFQDFLTLIVRIVVVYLLVTGFSFFNTVIFDPLTQAPGQLAIILASHSGATNVNELIDGFLKTGWIAIDVIEQNAGTFDAGAFALSLIMFTATLLVGAVSFVVFALAKVVLALSLMLAPVFCAFLAFQATRGWFESWLRMLFQAGLVLILAAGTMAIIMALATDGLAQLNAASGTGSIGIDDCVTYLTLAFVTIILMPQLNNIAASLAAGGASLSYHGVNRLARQTMGSDSRSDHETSKRRWQEDKPVSTAGSILNAAAGVAGAGFSGARSWRQPANPDHRGRRPGGAPPPPATPFEKKPKYDPRDTSAQALEWRVQENRRQDQEWAARKALEDKDG